MKSFKLTSLKSGRVARLSQSSHSQDMEEIDEVIPRDLYNLVYICMVMVGAGYLIPWGAYIGAFDYFFYYYLTEFPTVSVAIPIIYLATVFLAGSVNVLVEMHLHSRITIGYVLFVLSLLSVLLLDIGLHNCTISTAIGFYITLFTVGLVGIGAGAQQSSYYGLSSMLPRKYTQAVMAGESVSGLASISFRILTKAIVRSERVGVLIFFGISLCFVFLSMCCHWYIRGNKMVIFFVKNCDGRVKTAEVGGESEINTSLTDRDTDKQHNLNVREVCGEEDQLEGVGEVLGKEMNGADISLQEDEDLSRRACNCLGFKFHSGQKVSYVKRCWRVVLQIWPLMGAISFTFYVTLLLFPGLISEVQEFRLGSWTPIVLIATFNLMDFIARWLALVHIRWSPKQLLLSSFGRVIFIPLVLLCVSPSPTHPVLGSNVVFWAVLFTIFLGISNGYFGSLPLIHLSAHVKQAENKQLAGMIMGWMLHLGLLTGAVSAYALTPLTTLTHHTQCSNVTMELFDLCN